MNLLTTVSKLAYRIFTIPASILVTLVYVWFIVSVMPEQSLQSAEYAGDWGAPDRHFFYTPDELYAEISGWSEAGRDHYINFRLGLDILWALAYTGFLCGWISVLLNSTVPSGDPERLLNLFPLITLVADYSENFLGIWLVANSATRMDAVAWLATGITGGKWMTLVMAHGILIYAVIRAWRHKYGR